MLRLAALVPPVKSVDLPDIDLLITAGLAEAAGARNRGLFDLAMAVMERTGNEPFRRAWYSKSHRAENKGAHRLASAFVT